MKAFLVSMILVLGFSFSAQAIVFENNTDEVLAQNVIGLKVAELSSVEILKADDALAFELEFLMSGCLSQLAPLTHTVVRTEKELVIVVSALEIQVQEERRVKCVAAKMLKKGLYVPLEKGLLKKYKGQFRLQFAKTERRFEVMDMSL